MIASDLKSLWHGSRYIDGILTIYLNILYLLRRYYVVSNVAWGSGHYLCPLREHLAVSHVLGRGYGGKALECCSHVARDVNISGLRLTKAGYLSYGSVGIQDSDRLLGLEWDKVGSGSCYNLLR